MGSLCMVTFHGGSIINLGGGGIGGARNASANAAAQPLSPQVAAVVPEIRAPGAYCRLSVRRCLANFAFRSMGVVACSSRREPVARLADLPKFPTGAVVPS